MKEKMVLLAVLLLCAVMFPLMGNAEIVHSGTYGDNLTWTIDGDGQLTISGQGDMPDFESPWEDYGDSIHSIVIKEGITRIGYCAFYFYPNDSFSSVSIPSTVESIAFNAFRDCDGLSQFQVSSSNPFFTSLDGVLYDKKITKLIAYPEGKKEQTVNVPSTVRIIGSGAFYCNYNIAKVVLPPKLTSIEGGAFSLCGKLAQINLPESLTEIGYMVFSYCTSLSSIQFPPALKSIDSGAFSGCGFTEIIFPDQLQSIGYIAFCDNANLVSVTIPECTTSLANDIFKDCSPDLVITAVEGSPAVDYAIKNNIKYQVVKPKVTITAQPVSMAVNEGERASFTVTASHANTYQWYYRTSADSAWTKVKTNGTDATYSLTTAARHNGYQYRCLVENDVDSVYSQIVTLSVSPKPTITTQPVDAKVNEGETATFKVTATGAASYQWHYRTSSSGSWTAVSNNGTAATYNLSTLPRHNGYQYRCQVKNSAGSVYSNVVTLSVAAKPTISTQPVNVKVNKGETASFKVTAANASSYQWYYHVEGDSTWTAVKTNGTEATYTLTTAARHNGYQYRCQVSNSAGSVYTNTVTLTVVVKPTITTQPVDAKVNEGETATFKVTATGAASYQWHYRTSSSGSWTAVSNNGTAATYNLSTLPRHNGYQYRCQVKNSAGSVYSNVVTLSVAAKPTISTQPVNVKVNKGETATFKVTAANASSYQWYYHVEGDSTWTTVKTNGTEATYTLTTAARHNGYQYRCQVSNSAGSVYTNTVTLTVVVKPTITTQPVDAKVNEGETVTFKVTATGAASYQWYYHTSLSGSWTAVSNNGTAATYNLSTLPRHNGYQYRCQVKNSAGSVYSNVVTLSVTAKPVISTQPVNVKVNIGETAAFKVTASNASSYQWYYRVDGDTIWTAVKTNGTDAAYTLTTAERHNGYQYRCQVSNSAGSVYTNTVTLTVVVKPTITTQPVDVKVNEGETATFKVTAIGATGYQWYYRTSSSGSWTAVSNNGTAATYNLSTLPRHNGYQYRCQVKNSAGSVYSNTVTLTISIKPVITKQPANIKVKEGETATFEIVASNASSYQWYYRVDSSSTWTAVKTNGTAAAYTLTAAARHNGYQYRCCVKNSEETVYSNTVTLNVASKPVITSQPQDANVIVGKEAVFTVEANGATSYQWYYRTSSAGSWTEVSNNGTSATYVLIAAARHNGYQYRCQVKNSVGSVYTNVVTLTVGNESITSIHVLYGKTISEANELLEKILIYIDEGYYSNGDFGVRLDSNLRINWMATLNDKYSLFGVKQGMGWVYSQALLAGYSDWGWRPINNSPSDNIFTCTKYPDRIVMFSQDSDGKVKNIVYGDLN